MSYAYKTRSKLDGACYLSDKQNKRSELVKSLVNVNPDNICISINPANGSAACLRPLQAI